MLHYLDWKKRLLLWIMAEVIKSRLMIKWNECVMVLRFEHFPFTPNKSMNCFKIITKIKWNQTSQKTSMQKQMPAGCQNLEGLCMDPPPSSPQIIMLQLSDAALDPGWRNIWQVYRFFFCHKKVGGKKADIFRWSAQGLWSITTWRWHF